MAIAGLSTSRGFTLIELICVIVILGVLAATALPRFLDLRDDAGDAAARGVAATLTSAAQLNYAKSLASGSLSGVVDVKSQSADCNTLRHMLLGGFESFPSQVEFVQGSMPIACSPHAAGGTNSVCRVRARTGGDRTGYPVMAVCTSTN